MGMNQSKTGKLLMLLAVSAGLTLLEVVMVYIMRTRGPIPFKIKFHPDFDL